MHRYVACYLNLVAFLLITATSDVDAAEKNTRVIDNPAYTQAQRLVEIEPGRRLNVYCTGGGSPTVIFDSGLGDGTKAWGLVQPLIAAKTRTCSYDRAGLGFSDPSSLPRTSANIVADLHRLLAAAGIKPPYVLVGHSFGGMNAKLYAETYPAEVKGIVFVDPSHEDQGRMIWDLDPGYEAKYLPYIAILKRCAHALPTDFVEGSELHKNCVGAPGPRYSESINRIETTFATQPGRLKAWISEQENIWFTSADQVRAAYRFLGDTPIVVLTKEPQAPTGEESQQLRDAKNHVWELLHNRIAAMSNCGVRRVVMNTGHYIQLDQPGVVTGTVLEIVRAVRERYCASAP